VVPGAVAVCEEKKFSTRELIAAVVVGYDIVTRVGMAVSPSIYDISKWIELWDIWKFLKRDSWPILCVYSQQQTKELLQRRKITTLMYRKV
jgi:hypothetical protein